MIFNCGKRSVSCCDYAASPADGQLFSLPAVQLFFPKMQSGDSCQQPLPTPGKGIGPSLYLPPYMKGVRQLEKLKKLNKKIS